MQSPEDKKPVHIPIDGELDLHMFRPSDIKSLIPNYIEECLKRDILAIRIIHGKGRGELKRGVHALLEKNKSVQHYKLADGTGGSWGATLVILKK